MEAYPPEYVEHNLPLIVLSGLGEPQDGLSPGSGQKQESGTRLTTKSPECAGEKASQVRQGFFNHDGRDELWNATSLPGPTGTIKYRMKAVGRSYTLPPRKAAPLPQSSGIDGPPGPPMHHPRSSELHSTLSPLSPGSPLFADGVFTPLWFAKHQHRVPAFILAFFDISADDTTAQNEQIQMDINAIRTSLSGSGFKTKFAAVLMSDKSILEAPQLEDRLSSIRRATTLDPKNGLFFMPPMSSPAEIETFVQSVLATIQPLCIEYYRDLTKHARRKKTRGSPPQTVHSGAGGSQSLSTPGWNVRYELKQGVFAEFRQEMDVAERHYAAALEELFSSEVIFETTPSWSPRWNETRLLCDSIAVRVIRCQLFNSYPTGTVISFFNYQGRTRDLIDRRGKGSQTYSWSAWEARWATIMAQLIRRAGLPAFQAAYSPPQGETGALLQKQVYAMPEKTTERLVPFRYLHHPGYWHKLALKWLRTRREQASKIPDEDRNPPGQSPASAVAKRQKDYDFYLVPEPHEEVPLPGATGYDHITEFMKVANDSVKEFGLRSQLRMTEGLRLDMAREMMSKSERLDDAMDLLLPLWQNTTWRGDGWSDIYGQLLELTHTCAKRVGNAETLLSTSWELLANETAFSVEDADFTKCLDSIDSAAGKIDVKVEDGHVAGPIYAAFAFENKNGHVGDPLECQLTLSSRALEATLPITLSVVEITMSSSKLVRISHKPSSTPSRENEVLTDLTNAKENEDGSLFVEADLTLHPKQTRIFGLNLIFREAQNIRVSQVSIFVETESFRLEHTFTDDHVSKGRSMVSDRNGVLETRSLPNADTTGLTVLPKPPKLRLALHGLQQEHYTDEHIPLEVEFINEEADEAKIVAHVTMIGETGDAAVSATVKWVESGDDTAELAMPEVAASASHKARILLGGPIDPSMLSLQVEANYTLSSDPNTPISKVVRIPITFAIPFESKFSVGPRYQPGQWPSLFSAEEGTEKNPSGISQRWRLEAELQSLAAEDIIIQKVDLTMDGKPNDSICDLIDWVGERRTLLSHKSSSVDFEFLIRKISLDDRRPTALELSLEVTWQRDAESEAVITAIPVPRLTLPSSEPKVMCTLGERDVKNGQVIVNYTVENPSLHFLTFALTMEASEGFAFSGPKYRSLSLAPLTRHTAEYRLMVYDLDEETRSATENEGRWISPMLQVIDSYYQKNLKIFPGGPGVELDGTGLKVLVEEPKTGNA